MPPLLNAAGVSNGIKREASMRIRMLTWYGGYNSDAFTLTMFGSSCLACTQVCEPDIQVHRIVEEGIHGQAG